MIKHFLTLQDITSLELDSILAQAIHLKAQWKNGVINDALKNRSLGMIFEKSSTRTRVSFEAGMTQLGGHSIFLSPNDTQLGRGEPVEDSARVISRMVDMIMVRTFDHTLLEKFAHYSKVPVINALTDSFHPCQLLADLQTYTEHRGSPKGKVVTWVGDGNNMCHSYINAAALCDFELRIACPKGYEPNEELVAKHKDRLYITHDPKDACKDSDWIATDVWASMGQEAEQKKREAAFAGYEVNHDLMSAAKSDAVFMHCLPAHRGEEVSAELMEDDTLSVVWDEAENRLHAQKALMLFLAQTGNS